MRPALFGRVARSAAHETRAINLRSLRDAQIADFKTNILPAGAADGVVTWVRLDNLPVMSRLMVIRRGQGMASSYDCCICSCPNSFQAVEVPNNGGYGFAFLPGAAENFSATAVYVDCNDAPYYYDVTDVATWMSSSTSIATVETYGDSSPGLMTAVAGGQTTISAFYWDAQYTYDYSSGSCQATQVQENGYCPITVQVPTSLKYIGTVSQGAITSCTVTINGNNYPGAGWTREITWQVLDQYGQPILYSGLQPSDSLANAGGTNTCAFPASGGKTGTGNTGSNGEFPDTYSICSTACVNGGSCQSTENQSWTVSGTALTSDVKKVVYTCSGITINGQ